MASCSDLDLVRSAIQCNKTVFLKTKRDEIFEDLKSFPFVSESELLFSVFGPNKSLYRYVGVDLFLPVVKKNLKLFAIR